MSKLVKPALNLKQFLLRQQVFKLYRDIYRTINKIPEESSRKDLKIWLQSDFRNNKTMTEEISIKMAMQVGHRQLKELKNSLELSGVTSDDKKR